MEHWNNTIYQSRVESTTFNSVASPKQHRHTKYPVKMGVF